MQRIKLVSRYTSRKITLLAIVTMESIMDHSHALRSMFYALSPNETYFETVEEVPDYFIKIAPYLLLLWHLEALFMRLYKKKRVRFNESYSSVSQGMLYELFRLIAQTWQIAAYIYIYTNWRLVDLPWNSLWTWWISLLAVDFLYYWQHRACHEVNVLWAAHQVHHSSEDYNLSTAMRQSMVLNNLLVVFSLPVALVIPPTAFLVHNQLNAVYQIWIHTEAIQSIGPLEYVLNTASHHRVHHGRNRYCIDKNYGGVLIIWDRIFGTFEAEGKEVVYGVTQPVQSFAPLHVQFACYVQLWKRFWATEGIRNKVSVLFKGPGWSPGKPRLGSIEDIPDVSAPVQKYDPYVSLWCQLYGMFHGVILISGVVEMSEGRKNFPAIILYGTTLYIVFSVISIGALFEGRSYFPWLEMLRCAAFVLIDKYYLPLTRINLLDENYQHLLYSGIRLAFVASMIFWLQYCLKNFSFQLFCNSTKWINSKKWIGTFHTKVPYRSTNLYVCVPILMLFVHNYYSYGKIPFVL